MVYIYNVRSFGHKKEETLAICNNMDWTRGRYVKRNKPEKDKYCTISPICGIETKQSQTTELMDTKNRWAVVRGKMYGVGEMGQGATGTKFQL